MSTEESQEKVASTTNKMSLKNRLLLIGPGLVMAATGVGGGDLVTAIVAGAAAGTTLLWAVLLATILKFTMTEAIGRSFLASGRTLVYNWASLGKWVLGVVLIYVLLWGLAYGAAGPSTVGLAANAMFPGLSVSTWAIVHSILAFVLIFLGRYILFENIMKFFVLVMFIGVVGTAILVSPNLLDIATGIRPNLAEGGLIYAIAIMGGMGGTLTLVSYGYWIRDKGWNTPSWVPMMRIDSVVGYLLAGMFAASALIIGAEMMFATGSSFSGDSQGLVILASSMEERYGSLLKWLFLIGFWAITFSSVLGVWNGIAYVFADIVRVLKGVPDSEADAYISEKSFAYRSFLVLITFAAMPFILISSPVPLLISWALLGALFLPFLAGTLVWLLNSQRIEQRYRNRPVGISNVILVGGLLIFIVLGIQTIALYLL